MKKKNKKKNVEELIKTLRSEDYDVRWRATEILVDIGKPAVEPLIQCLNDQFRMVRLHAAWALWNIGDARAVEPLIRSLNDEFSGVRNQAVIGLREIRDARAIEPLIQTSKKDKDSRIREEAKIALDWFKTKKSTKKKRTFKPNVKKLKENEDKEVKGVKFVGMKYRDSDFFGTRYTYEVYSAENKKQAWEFIKTKSVDKKHYYIEVNVGDVNDPEVIVGLDIQGTYET